MSRDTSWLPCRQRSVALVGSWCGRGVRGVAGSGDSVLTRCPLDHTLQQRQQHPDRHAEAAHLTDAVSTLYVQHQCIYVDLT